MQPEPCPCHTTCPPPWTAVLSPHDRHDRHRPHEPGRTVAGHGIALAIVVGNAGRRRIAGLAWGCAGGSPGKGKHRAGAVPPLGSGEGPARQGLTNPPVVVLEDAIGDIERARDFYERIRSGLGAYFVGALLADIETLSHAHGIHARCFGFRRKLSARFPFGIYYRETPERTEIFAVLDLRRDPRWLGEELAGRIG